MIFRKRVFQASLEWLVDWQILPVGLVAPIFIFPTWCPPWVVALALLVIPGLWGLHKWARGRFFTATPVDLPLLVLLATVPVGFWASPLPEVTALHASRYVIAVAVFYALVNTIRVQYRMELASWAVLAGTALLAGVSLLGTAWSGDTKFLPAALTQSVPRLVFAFWNPRGFNPNIVSGVLILLVPVTLAYAWGTGSIQRKLFFWFLFAVETFTLVLSQSRSALVGFAVALFVVAIGRDRRWGWLILILVVGLVLGAVFYGTQPSLSFVVEGIGESAVRSGETRLELLSRGIYMLEDYPFTGVGLGMFPRVLPLLYPQFLLLGPDVEVPHVHNLYLQIGIDHGIPGLIAYLALLILLWLMGIQSVRLSKGRPWEPLAIGLLAGLAAYCVHGFFDAAGLMPRAHLFIWGHLGLLAAVWCYTTRHSAAKEADG